jgi:hypothetical protein
MGDTLGAYARGWKVGGDVHYSRTVQGRRKLPKRIVPSENVNSPLACK